MDFLPNDPFMLMSTINMLLRDNQYDSLEDLCSAFDRDIEEIKDSLAAEGFEFNEQLKQFR
mgnify:CR=1 FL=1